ncbi:MAG: rod shape-determining protein RodA [Marinilabiliales bacterium]|nr:MAG: rod shape-determining protein RodA [Marinilabiliales bacterium]
MRRRGAILSNTDPVMVILYFVLVLIGWINIYAATYTPEHSSIFDLSMSYGRQILWIGTSCIIIILILLTDSKFFSSFSFPIYIFFLGLLVGVLLFGKVVAGSRSWFQIGSFALQPSEFAKFATCLAMAKFLSRQNFSLEKFRNKVMAFIILALPAGLIFLQNDTGSALVYAALILVLYREGLSANIFILALIVGVLFILTLLLGKYYVVGGIGALLLLGLWFMRKNRRAIMVLIAGGILAAGFIFSVDYAFENILEPHQKTRINVLLGLEQDLRGAGYNVHQSKIAIGSGGFAGKGFLQGTQTKFDFVPEQSTDFIFCTIGEEWGFLGTSLVIILFLALLIRIVMVAERQRSSFARIYGYGVASILFFHFTINIGMTIGLIPVIGIPLPFFSYGGSSLWAFTVLLFIFIKMDSYRLDLL